jgi:3-oxoacyl-[acyl-carrier-protein] synthase II
MGAVTPIGIGKEEYWQNLLKGVSGVKSLVFPTMDMDLYRTKIAASLDAFDPSVFFPNNKNTKYQGRTSQVALAATKLALEDGGFEIVQNKKNASIDGIDPDRIGVIMGTGSGNMDILEEGHGEFLQDRGPKRTSPHALPQQIISAVPANIAMYYQCRGISYAIPTACSSANQAIGNSFRHLKYGSWEDIVITGGADCCITPLIFGCFAAMRAMSTRNDEPTKATRPFDKGRDGFVMGEGAGIIVLEKLDHALKRNAPIYAEIVGFGMTSDAYHITIPNLEGEMFYRAIQMALHEGGLSPDEVDYINAHGTSTRLNDPIETRAIKRAFGKRAYQIPINSTKSMVGRLIGAAGGVEAIASVMSINENRVHPTINYENSDPECDLDYVPNEMREVPVRVAMSNSLGFGGFNSVVILKQYEA